MLAKRSRKASYEQPERSESLWDRDMGMHMEYKMGKSATKLPNPIRLIS